MNDEVVTAARLIQNQYNYLNDEERSFLAILLKGLGHSFSEPVPDDYWSMLPPPAIALWWELLWRMRPELPSPETPASELPHHSNPLFNPKVVSPGDLVIAPSYGNPEAQEFLTRMAAIECSPSWPLANPIAETYVTDAREYRKLLQAIQEKILPPETQNRLNELKSTLEQAQEYLSRVILRGDQEQVIEALRAHFTVAEEYAKATLDREMICEIFIEDVVPFIALGYQRIWKTPLNQAIDFFHETVERFSSLVRMLEHQSTDKNVPTTDRKKGLEQKLLNWPYGIGYSFPTIQKIGDREFDIANFLDFWRDIPKDAA
jgi:hypothetical protein